MTTTIELKNVLESILEGEKKEEEKLESLLKLISENEAPKTS